jgi:hypothetical protein
MMNARKRLFDHPLTRWHRRDRYPRRRQGRGARERLHRGSGGSRRARQIFLNSCAVAAVAVGEMTPGGPSPARKAALGIGHSRHELVIDRALAAVDAGNGMVRQVQENRGTRDINGALQDRPRLAPLLRNQNHIEAFKLRLVEQMAAELT